MSLAEPMWIVVVRDVSGSVRVEDESEVFATLILDAETGIIRGVALAPTARESCAEAAEGALTRAPVAEMPPNPPGRIVFGEAFGADVLEALDDVLPPSAAPELLPASPVPEAEDILDSLLGHLAGRGQPDDIPDRGDWAELFARALAFCRAEPWRLRSDAEHLDVVVTADGSMTRYVGVVLGQEGLQRGLALYPGTALPADFADWVPGTPPPVPDGSLVLWLDPPAELPPDLTAKAARYGWPGDLDLAPVLARLTPGGLVDLDRTAARRLSVALAAVVAHSRPHVVPAEPDEPLTTTGTVELPGGFEGEFSCAG